MQYTTGDRVRLRGLVHSDCLGRTGIVLEARPSVFFGTGTQRCRVDFNGRVRRVLNIHLAPLERGSESKSVA